jgi:hypothetical protein
VFYTPGKIISGRHSVDESPDKTAVAAMANSIVYDDEAAIATGAGRIPREELVIEPNPADYVAPEYLSRTAPDIAGLFGQLLESLCELNRRFAGWTTLEAQGYLSLTGLHEELEECFLAWTQSYFKQRGSLDRLNPRNQNDPWRLYGECHDEAQRLIDSRIHMPGTLNSIVLNQSQRYVWSDLALRVLGEDLGRASQGLPDRFGSPLHRSEAAAKVGDFLDEVKAFTTFFDGFAAHLPPAYTPEVGPEWQGEVCRRLAARGQDLNFFRNVLCVLSSSASEPRQLHPSLWGQLRWDVYHGRSVAALRTSSTGEYSSPSSTNHQLAFRRDGLLCHREYSWIRVNPDYRVEERRLELAVNLYLLDTLTEPLYDAWLALSPAAVIELGMEPDASEEVQDAAITVALAKPEPELEEPAREKKLRTPKLWLSDLERITAKHFNCEWSQAKGSERKVHRQGTKMFTIGCHGADREVPSGLVRRCLNKLGIPVRDFLAVCR